MKQFLSLIIGTTLLSASCAQTKMVKLPNAHAFFNVTVPGALQMDENGNPVNRIFINRFIYIETIGKQPFIIYSISSGNKKYKFTIEEEKLIPVIAGNDYTTNLPVKIKAAKNNKLWKVSLTPESDKDTANPIKNIVIRGKVCGKVFKLVVPKDEQLAGPLMY